MILYMFQCHSPKSSHPLLLPQSPKDCSIHLCLFCCLKCHTKRFNKNVSPFVKIGFEWDWQRQMMGNYFDHSFVLFKNLKKACVCIGDIKSLEKNKSTLDKIHSSLYRFISISFLGLWLSFYLLYTKRWKLHFRQSFQLSD